MSGNGPKTNNIKKLPLVSRMLVLGQMEAQSQLSVTCLIFNKNCAIVATLYNYWLQPLIKGGSIWMDHKTLFPVLETGFCF